MIRGALGAALALILSLGGGMAVSAQEQPEIAFAKVEASPFARTLTEEVEVPAAQRTTVRLRKLSEKRNPPEDFETWLSANGLTPPWAQETMERPVRGRAFGLPDSTLNETLNFAVLGPDGSGVGGYGRDRRLVIVSHPKAGQIGLDLSGWNMPPRFLPEDRDYVELETLALAGGTGMVYVATGHRTYARSSMGINAFVSAIDPTTGKVLWQSDPLVANASTMVLVGDALITGYGFTDEPDFMYVLDARDGTRVQKLPVRSGPETLILKDDRLYVRTYNTDYVFAVEGVP